MEIFSFKYVASIVNENMKSAYPPYLLPDNNYNQLTPGLYKFITFCTILQDSKANSLIKWHCCSFACVITSSTCCVN